MDFRYTPAQQDLKRRAADYVKLLIQYEDQAEQARGALPKSIVRELTLAAMDAGVYAINMPVEWGGPGLSLLEQVIVEEEFGKATNCLWDIPWRPSNVLAYGTPEQREKYLLPIIRGEKFDAFAVTEPEAGSDPSSGVTVATRTAGGWLLNGEKWFVTCGDIADFLLVQADAIVEGAQGPEKLATLFFVDKNAPGLEMTRVPHFMHHAVNGHPEFTLTDVFVADEDVLGDVGEGYELTKEWFTDERLMIAARTVGAAERALSEARDWAVRRQAFGQPIAEFQLIQGMLADCAVDIAVNRAYTHQVAWEADQPDTDRKTLHAKASTAKLAASEAAGRVADRCVQIFGGRGYDSAFAVERIFRELRVDRIWEGTSEIQRVIIANELIKRGTRSLALPRPAAATDITAATAAPASATTNED
ncbi:acyl-CoA dehydrogenase domain protein [Catenulispora acidiphila DSM 44928]|uniref:Acyl-CoA dehydrogenase domain protein n=1 Tax=Catenulispora acidiphila (strain DSM 44928 / JCM 14897 / NBRC 102108 / NRRL B-24433 / ID139908) TaxID=479433 RepID=C7Q9U8_CATAD|nr:acyl-CoA dehydrogenase family protein [Catenulispora acidiphila]ACU76267.1 acyl-CoA dehydrogenase domain protein [Catenulispora acidiphila DSM 44928]